MSEQIIKKLNEINNSYGTLIKYWKPDEKRELLELYLLFCKNESEIFDLIYKYHRCDSWEDIFRDYDPNFLKAKEIGVKVAINELIKKNK